MKSSPSLFSFKYLHIVAILFFLGLALIMGSTNTASALTSSQQISINNELSKYKKYITTHPNQFKTQESINQFYRKLKIALINKLEVLNGVIDSLPVDIVSSLPITTTQPNCSGITPSGAGVIKSTNLTSFGGGGIPPWSFNETYSWNGTDAGISCVWKCSAGYSKSGNGCVVATNPITLSITINQGAFYCGNPDTNNYNTYNPSNKIVVLNNTIIASCTTKGGKVWTKSINGTIENLKNISDVKNGDIFTTSATITAIVITTQPNCSGTAPSGVGVIKSTNLTSFGGGGASPWEFDNIRSWNGTDAGISCVWKCSPGYNRSGNGCVVTTTQPNCSGIAPSGAGVIKSTNLTSFGGGGASPWEFDNIRSWNGTDAGISCVWKCSAGYNRSGNGCVVATNPKIIWTDSTYSSNYAEYRKSSGDKLYGYIQGGDVNNTWSCLAPPTFPNNCDTSVGFRQLGGTGDGWQLNPTTGRIELNVGISVVQYPTGSYVGFIRTGQNGTDTTSSTFRIID